MRVHWSNTILDEVRRNLALRHDLNVDAIDYRIDRMNLALRDALQGLPHEDLVQSMPVNSKDRHVLALAVHVQADCIATFDLDDLPAARCAPYGVEPLHPDELLHTIITDAPERVVAVVEEMAARRRRPPMTPAALLDRWEAAVPKSGGVPALPSSHLGPQRSRYVSPEPSKSRRHEPISPVAVA